MIALQSPYPYFGGKSKVADLVWDRFGNIQNYVEPFFGSGAMLLARPTEPGTETVNDINGYISNFWRAVAADAEQVAHYADWPVNENDLHARHIWLVEQKDDMRARLEGDPEWCDAKIAGWWVWGMACWIGSGFCDGQGPWQVEDGKLVHLNNGQGVHRQRVHLGNKGRGVHRQLVHLGNKGQGIYEWFTALQDRMRRVRVCCGDWARVCTDTPTVVHGLTGVFLDPPYAVEDRHTDCYGEHDSTTIAHDVREWALANGERMRIALCGYDGEHMMPDDWECVEWKAHGGYASQSSRENVNATRERIWFSPMCLRPARERQEMLFA